MRDALRLVALIVPALLVFAQSHAQAAVAKSSFYACKDQGIFKKAFQQPAGKPIKDKKAAQADIDAYFKAKIAAGDCVPLARGENVTVDQRDKDMWCVRPSGGLDCYWTVDKAVDLDASSSSGEQAHHGKSH